MGIMVPGAAFGYLRLHPENPRYFQETRTGEAVLITGYASIVPSDVTYDYVKGLDEIRSWRVHWSRVWHFLPWATSNAIWPWARSATPGAYMGGNKFDLGTWNDTYWRRLKDSLARAQAGGVYAEIHLFDRVGLSPADWERYGNNPWASNNNVNGLEMPPADRDGTPEFYEFASRPNLRTRQEAYVRKMIEETIGYPNVIYEIENEHWESDDPAFADHWARFVKAHIAANYPSQPRLVSYSSLERDLDEFLTRDSVDVVNRHYGNEAEGNNALLNQYLEGNWQHGKAINVDEFANGVTDPALLRRMCWIIVTSGGHFHIEDADLAARPFEVVENLRAFKALSGWDFVHASPRKAVVSGGGGYCMEQAGVEYVCYFPQGGTKTLTLASGDYRGAWWNPRTGGFTAAGRVAGGAARTLAPPAAGDWVLHLTTRSALATVLEARPAPTLEVDGRPDDWPLGQFVGRIAGGNAGEGQIGFVGHDGVSTHAGGHWTGGQYPPADARDHAVRVHAAHDAAALYFLIRVDDDDVRTPNGADMNWANDCVEIYLDPGRAGGASPIANSTTAVQLVIDAANRGNAYAVEPAYRDRVLAGVTSAVSRDAQGWWLEARVEKSALSPALPASGLVGVDFVVRDNDGADAQTTIDSWSDPETSDAFPSKIPDRWGALRLPPLGAASDGGASPDAGTPPDGGPPADGGARRDGGVQDAGAPAADAGTSPSPDAGSALADGGAPSRSTGGGCAAAGTGSWTWAVLAVVACAAAALRRRAGVLLLALVLAGGAGCAAAIVDPTEVPGSAPAVEPPTESPSPVLYPRSEGPSNPPGQTPASGGEGPAPCEPGEVVPCQTPCGTAGRQVCDADGRLGACQPTDGTCSGGELPGCDSATDPACARQCSPGQREACETTCGSEGTRTCDADGRWSACQPPPELCGNGEDDNCDGRVDEGCQECTPGTTRTCAATCGSQGTQTCDGNGKWTPICQPPAEICGNGRDDDCDGQVDEGCQECTPGTRRTCQTTCGSQGTQTCDGNGKWTPICQPPAEVCGNGRDDDCDGQVDEGCVVACEDTLGGRCGDNNPGYGDCCSDACNTYHCDPDKFWAWCNRRNPAYPDIWYNFLRDWVDQHCDGQVLLGDLDGNGYPSFYCTASNGIMYTCNTPLVLSFTPGTPASFTEGMQTFELTPGQASACFDWPTAATPWLALDRDSSGAIQDGSELFGSATRLAGGGIAANGFEALADLDVNRDGWVDGLDEAFGRLVAWGDADRDGISQPEELVSIADLGVVAISLDYTVVPRCDARGNCERERAVFLWRDAAGWLRKGEVIDVHLPVRLGCAERP
jgi:hypothetical protein